MKMRIAIVVPGRFDAFDLTRELLRQGQEVILLTNYPKSIVCRYGVPRERIQSALWHGLLIRASERLRRWIGHGLSEALIHRLFSRWALGRLRRVPDLDVVYCFSGVAEEIFRGLPSGRPWKSLVRGSSHIRTQTELLEAEALRAASLRGQPVAIDKPTPWMVAREEREYELADHIFVLSSFAALGFRARPELARKLSILGLGSQISLFRPPASVIEQRCARVLGGATLRVLTVGTFSLQKGVIDLCEIARQLAGRCSFEFVGVVAEDARWLRDTYGVGIKFRERIPQQELPKVYAAADLFLFPTIQDGYAVVLAQAHASGLPILASTNCAAPDLVVEGRTGWVLPIRTPAAYVSRLMWCDEHRQELAAMMHACYYGYCPRDWTEVADTFLSCHFRLLLA